MKKKATAHTPKPKSSKTNKQNSPRVRITKLGTERLIAHNARFCRQWYSKDPDLKYANAKQLAAEFHVDEKTIREDIKLMRDRLRLPCQYIARRRGYGYTQEVTSFPLTHLSQGDVLFYCAGLSALESFRGIPLSDHAGGAFDKVLQGLDQSHSLKPQRIRELISFRPSSYYTVIDPQVYELVAGALLDQEELRFTYTKLTDAEVDRIDTSSPIIPAGPTQRHVQPRHLACIESSLYLFVDDLTQRDSRKFALSRMSNVQRTGKHFTPTKPFNIEKALESAFNAYSSGKRIDVRVRFTGIGAGLIAERRYHDARALIHNPDGSLDLIRRVAPSPQIPGWVLSFGADAEVISPQSVKDAVDNIIRKLHSRLPSPSVPS